MKGTLLSSCTLLLLCQQTNPGVYTGTFTVTGNLLQSVLESALNDVKNVANNAFNTATTALGNFENTLKAEKKKLEKDANAAKAALDKTKKFWQGRVNDLRSINQKSDYNQLSDLVNRYTNDARNGIKKFLQAEIAAHKTWYNSLKPVVQGIRYLDYEVRLKILEEAIRKLDDNVNAILAHVNSVKPLADLIYPFIKKIIEGLLNAAEAALVVANAALKKGVDTVAKVGAAALVAVEAATGLSKAVLTQTKKDANAFFTRVKTYIGNGTAIEIVQATFSARLDTVHVGSSFDASITITLNPIGGTKITKTVNAAIDFNDLTKTAKDLLRDHGSPLNLTQ